jgi:hypothetical protein
MSFSISEAVGNQSQMKATLAAGLNTLDQAQTVVFTQYTKTVLPADGYVFWVASESTITVCGSVHFGIAKQQNEDETIAVNHVIFTAETQVQDFDAVSPTTMYVGTFDGLQFAFSNQGNFYRQADLWHYRGDAVYPALASQLVSSSAGLAALEPIVSNSLPIWLSQNSFAPVYPSYLVADNIAPPYISVHIEPEGTEALQAFPVWAWPQGNFLTTNGTQNVVDSYGNPLFTGLGITPTLYQQSYWQLMKDRVRLTLYGFNNQTAIQYLSSLMLYSLNTDAFGFMNSPAVRDDKRTQVELGVIAQRKHIDLEVSYYQATAAAISQRMIISASVGIRIYN